jgi:3-dehydroquinate synthase
MAQVRVDLGERSYSIHIGSGLLAEVGPLLRETAPQAARALLIADSHTGPLYGEQVLASLRSAGTEAFLATVPAGEQSKSLRTAESLYERCLDAALERSSVIVALGGGVIGDLAGFVAATYLRGLPFVQVPTSLLAQVDSAVGGKVAVDLARGKNLVGAFHQPRLVVADVAALRSLPAREVAAGLAEVVKHAVIRDGAFLTFLEENAGPIASLEPALLEQLVARNCAIKAAVVGADETETRLRAILNFGHTAGHAIEALRWESLRHGECVAIGMVVASQLAAAAGVLQDPELPGRVRRLLERLGLPTQLPVTPAELLPVLYRDKKVEGGKLRWVLPVRPGEVVVRPVGDDLVLQTLRSLV